MLAQVFASEPRRLPRKRRVVFAHLRQIIPVAYTAAFVLLVQRSQRVVVQLHTQAGRGGMALTLAIC